MTEYRTKEGQPIQFETVSAAVGNLDRDRYLSLGNNAWSRFRLFATIDGARVGYITIAFIPQVNWNIFFPTIWHYAFRKSGWAINPAFLNSISPDMTDWTIDQKIRLVQASQGYLRDYVTVTEANVPDLWIKANQGIRHRMLDMYRTTKDHHLNKPLVEYIETNNDRLRQGIGLALYRYAAEWLHEGFALDLYASTLQSDPAKAAWVKMEQYGWVDYDKGRRRLRYDLCRTR